MALNSEVAELNFGELRLTFTPVLKHRRASYFWGLDEWMSPVKWMNR